MALIGKLGAVFTDVPVLVVTDSWFGNNGLLKPMRAKLGERAHLLSRLRFNAALYGLARAYRGQARKTSKSTASVPVAPRRRPATPRP